MLITVCHLRSSGFLGGPEKQLLGFAHELQNRGIRSFIAAWNLPSGAPDLLLKAASCGMPCAALPLRSPEDPRIFTDVARLLRRTQPSILAVHDYKAIIAGFPAARLLRIPLVAHARGWTFHTRRVQIYEALERALMRYADHIVTVSEAMRRELVSTGIDPNRVTAVHNSIIPPANPPSPLLRAAARKRLGLSENALVVGSVGRLSPEKGHRYLLEAAAKLNGSVPNFV
ncbi:MAG: glycosyltransferase, partial [Armatimonadota bacterium]